MSVRQYHGLSHITLTALWGEMALHFSDCFDFLCTWPELFWLCAGEIKYLVWLKTSHFALGNNLHISADVFQQRWVFAINVAL